MKDSKETPVPEEEIINVYAVEIGRTKVNHFTKNGQGYSTPLTTPQKETFFTWQAKTAYNSNPELKTLAANFAENYRIKSSTTGRAGSFRESP